MRSASGWPESLTFNDLTRNTSNREQVQLQQHLDYFRVQFWCAYLTRDAIDIVRDCRRGHGVMSIHTDVSITRKRNRDEVEESQIDRRAFVINVHLQHVTCSKACTLRFRKTGTFSGARTPSDIHPTMSPLTRAITARIPRHFTRRQPHLFRPCTGPRSMSRAWGRCDCTDRARTRGREIVRDRAGNSEMLRSLPPR